MPSSALTHLECSRCARTHDADVLQNRCECGGALVARYAVPDVALAELRARPAGMWRYRELLPVRGEPVSLGEPETPLLRLHRLSERLGAEVWLKDDSTLPGGTFKARGAAAGVSRAVELGASSLVMPTAGNAGGGWALYAARAGVPITVVMSHEAPAANRAEVEVAGGKLELVDGTLSDAGRRSREIAAETGAFLAATFYEPYRLEGKKTTWLEVFDSLGALDSLGDAMAFPRTIVMPLGGGVAALAAAKAAQEVIAAGWADGRPPMIVGVQPEVCAPITQAWEQGVDEVTPWTSDGGSIAAGLRVPGPAEGTWALRCVRESGGSMLAVSEHEIVDGLRLLAGTEGVFACPEGAAAVAGAVRLAGALEGPVLIYNTGAGIKYVDELVRTGV